MYHLNFADSAGCSIHTEMSTGYDVCTMQTDSWILVLPDVFLPNTCCKDVTTFLQNADYTF